MAAERLSSFSNTHTDMHKDSTFKKGISLKLNQPDWLNFYIGFGLTLGDFFGLLNLMLKHSTYLISRSIYYSYLHN